MHKNIHCRKLSPLCICRNNDVFYQQAVLTQRQRLTQNYFKSKTIGKYFKLDEILKISIM